MDLINKKKSKFFSQSIYNPIYNNLNLKEAIMSIPLGGNTPNFTKKSSEGDINFYDYLEDSWGVLFSRPKDFTPVCTTETGEVSKLKSEFEKRNVKVVGLSVDPTDSHDNWIQDINETQNTTMNFPVVTDADKKVSQLYDMVHPQADDTATVRSVFIIDPNKKVRLTLTYPATTGRNFDEILRVIDSIQLTEKYQVFTPVNWKHGDDVVIAPSIQDKEELNRKFPKGYRELRTNLRLTPQPNKE
jgi:alkyl hydroperoxide reductase subunit AhpC